LSNPVVVKTILPTSALPSILKLPVVLPPAKVTVLELDHLSAEVASVAVAALPDVS